MAPTFTLVLEGPKLLGRAVAEYLLEQEPPRRLTAAQRRRALVAVRWAFEDLRRFRTARLMAPDDVFELRGLSATVQKALAKLEQRAPYVVAGFYCVTRREVLAVERSWLRPIWKTARPTARAVRALVRARVSGKENGAAITRLMSGVRWYEEVTRGASTAEEAKRLMDAHPNRPERLYRRKKPAPPVRSRPRRQRRTARRR